VAVIASLGGTPLALAAKAATASIPIVFSVPDDPVQLGLVASLARPGGNMTGVNFFMQEITAKRLGFLHELVPKAARIAVLVNPTNPASAERTLKEVQVAAPVLGLQIHVFNASTSNKIDVAFAGMVRERCEALLVGGDAFFNGRRVQLAIMAARDRLPTSFTVREFVEAGGLMNYGTNLADTFRQVGTYTGNIINGAKPAELPVLQSTKFEFAINLHTAKALGLEVPPQLLASVDEVIE
jgi:putative ABC transport system substrate-binding protein